MSISYSEFNQPHTGCQRNRANAPTRQRANAPCPDCAFRLQFPAMEIGAPSPAYVEALDYLYSLINFERQRLDRYTASKLDPERPYHLVNFLGAPQNRFPAIHIAGTKGKGSVAAMCAYSLRAAGLRVGLYTSPHLQEFRERIRILTPEDADGRIPEAPFVDLVAALKTALNHVPDVTWFEAVTAIALSYFADQQIDVAVIETGLGGRLDATRVVNPLVSVITSLSLDHTELLGHTLAEIAYEKAGIIKPGIPVISAQQPPEAAQRLQEIAAERGSSIAFVGRALHAALETTWLYEGVYHNEGQQQQMALLRAPDAAFVRPGMPFTLALDGEHQLENAAVTLAALHTVQPHFPLLTETAVRTGLATVNWPGRLQIVHPGNNRTPALLVDCAHNPDSIGRLCHALTHDYTYRRLLLLFGAPADKDIAEMLAQLVPLADGIVTTCADHPRAATPTSLAQIVADLGGTAVASPSIAQALTAVWQMAQPGDLICATGSIIVVGDLLNQWERLKSHLLHQTTTTN
ncbi:MAG: bifunctional folylpolyglutamate synthase/dihydrofolate synthase [Chloroflexi bacterium]|nr:bifunctional folylpolyglutamate synthase/dihydrofolate synthase [Chloroflexota bacterium]